MTTNAIPGEVKYFLVESSERCFVCTKAVVQATSCYGDVSGSDVDCKT